MIPIMDHIISHFQGSFIHSYHNWTSNRWGFGFHFSGPPISSIIEPISSLYIFYRIHDQAITLLLFKFSCSQVKSTNLRWYFHAKSVFCSSLIPCLCKCEQLAKFETCFRSRKSSLDCKKFVCSGLQKFSQIA